MPQLTQYCSKHQNDHVFGKTCKGSVRSTPLSTKTTAIRLEAIQGRWAPPRRARHSSLSAKDPRKGSQKHRFPLHPWQRSAPGSRLPSASLFKLSCARSSLAQDTGTGDRQRAPKSFPENRLLELINFLKYNIYILRFF